MFGREKHAARNKSASEDDQKQHEQDHPSCKRKVAVFKDDGMSSITSHEGGNMLHKFQGCQMRRSVLHQRKASLKVKEALSKGDKFGRDKRRYKAS